MTNTIGNAYSNQENVFPERRLDCALKCKTFQGLLNKKCSEPFSSNLGAWFWILRLRSLRGKTGGGPAGAMPSHGGAPLKPPWSSPSHAVSAKTSTKRRTKSTGAKRRERRARLRYSFGRRWLREVPLCAAAESTLGEIQLGVVTRLDGFLGA